MPSVYVGFVDYGRVWRHRDSTFNWNFKSQMITLWLFDIAMENGPFIVDLPIKNGGSFHCYVSLPEGKWHFGTVCYWLEALKSLDCDLDQV